MERTEPTFVPEWLKSTSHQLTSLLKSDQQGASKSLRNKSLDKDIGPVSVSDRTPSSYLSRTSISNGSANIKSYSSFNNNHGERDMFEFRNKEKPENRHGNSVKDGFGRSLLSVSGKRGESRPERVASDLTVVNKSSHINGGSLLSGNVKVSFERNFPSLGGDEKQLDSDIGRVSPGVSSAIQSLPVGNSTMIGGDSWTSALAEVPVIVSNNNNGNGSGVHSVQPISKSLTGGRNMAETLANGPPQTQTASQLTVGTQRLEELTVKQSRQLIPMTHSIPKALGSNFCDKSKPHIPRSANTKLDVSKPFGVGKLLVLKPSKERNGIMPTSKASPSPTTGSVVPLVVPLSKPGVLVLEKRPSSNPQSRINFFNLMRKKSMANNSSSVAPDTGEPVVPRGGSDLTVVSEIKVGQSGLDVVSYSEEEEARLLRAMGWEETAQEEVLTEEEISSFYQRLLKVKPASKGAQPKLVMPTSFNSKLDS